MGKSRCTVHMEKDTPFTILTIAVVTQKNVTHNSKPTFACPRISVEDGSTCSNPASSSPAPQTDKTQTVKILTTV